MLPAHMAKLAANAGVRVNGGGFVFEKLEILAQNASYPVSPAKVCPKIGTWSHQADPVKNEDCEAGGRLEQHVDCPAIPQAGSYTGVRRRRRRSKATPPHRGPDKFACGFQHKIEKKFGLHPKFYTCRSANENEMCLKKQ